jgi:hypothetical protein
MSLTTARPSSDLPKVVIDPKSVRTAFVDLIPPVRVSVGVIAHRLIQRTNGHGLHICVLECHKDVSEIPWAQQRVCHLLGGGCVDRSNSDIICPRGHSPFDLPAGITRYSNDRVRREKFASDFNGHVRLTEVNTLGLNSHGYVDPVIDNQWDFVLSTKLLRGTSNLEELNTSPNQRAGGYFLRLGNVDLLPQCPGAFPVLGPR